jgi:predicted phage terminase large subunit-like protein
MGMNKGIIDDPIKNRKEANSLTVRNAVWDWYISTFRTRLAPDGAILLTVTRWHEDDLAGRLLELAASDPKADQWVVISFPAVTEEGPTDIDPRQPGEALWPSRFDLDALEATRISLGSYEWASLYQQRPAPREGGMFKYEWFDIVPAVPGGRVRRVRYWDKAGSKDAGAHTAGVKMAIVYEVVNDRETNAVFYIEDVIMGQWGADEREPIIRQTAVLDGADVDIVVEQEPGSGGKESAENTVKSLPGYRVYTDRPTGDKALRAEPMAAQAAVRNVKLVKGMWNKRYLDILAAFPNGIKDPVDASSGGFNYLVNINPLGGIHV